MCNNFYNRDVTSCHGHVIFVMVTLLVVMVTLLVVMVTSRVVKSVVTCYIGFSPICAHVTPRAGQGNVTRYNYVKHSIVGFYPNRASAAARGG